MATKIPSAVHASCWFSLALCLCWMPNKSARGDTRPPSEHAAFGQFREDRVRMVREQLVRRGITDERVLSAMRRVPRHHFMPRDTWTHAYRDHPVRIGHRQTISQPYIVAIMTQLLGVKPGDRVLEVGTGSGYQAAVLAEIGAHVFTIEILEPLSVRARTACGQLGYKRIRFRVADGYFGWKEHTPFSHIIVTAAPPDEVPPPLLAQLAVGGRLVAPVGRGYQSLLVIERTADGYRRRSVMDVVFVPMTGKAQN